MFSVSRVNRAARCTDILQRQNTDHIVKCQAMGGQGIAINPHLKLMTIPAKHLDVSNSGNGQQPVFQVVFGQQPDVLPGFSDCPAPGSRRA